MGVAIADAAAMRGASVTLVLGPTHLRPKESTVKTVNVVSAADMARECISLFGSADIAILAAAVADFTPSAPGSKKIKRGSEDHSLTLSPTVDIAATLGSLKSDKQYLVGFALETDEELTNAMGKLQRKNLDMVVLNSLADKGAAFGHDTNLITIIDKSNNIDKFELKSKAAVADDILDKLESLIANNL